jgi:WD40 repeat protein
VLSVNYKSKTWNVDIKKEGAHTSDIYGLCALSNQRLVSCSGDKTIKIWRVGQNDLSLLSTLTNHTNYVRKAIPLPHNKFASCSNDSTVRIWNSEHPYQQLATLTHGGYVYYLLQLKKKDILVTSCDGDSSLYFWNSSTYQKLNTIKNVCTDISEHMIELPDGNIAVSSRVSPHPIVIINPTNYSIIKEIKDQEYITDRSALCLFDAYSFIYVRDGKFLQISNNNEYEILFKTKSEEQLYGWSGIINIESGKYLIIGNKSNGLEIVKPYY